MTLSKCYSFPDCLCGRTLRDISSHIDDWITDPVPREVVLDDILIAYGSLRCIEAYCSRPSVRQQAIIQLLHPVWNNLPKEYRR